MHKVIYAGQVEKDLKYLPKEVIRQTIDKIEKVISINPFAGEKLHYREKDLYRYRVRDYRVVYAIDLENKEIVVYRIRHRKEVYRKL